MLDLKTTTEIFAPARVLLGEALKIAKQKRNSEINSKLIELQGHILEIQQHCVDISTECERRGQRIAELERKSMTKEQFQFRDNMYWKGSEGPFCPRCLDVNNNIVRLAPVEAKGRYYCWECKSKFATPNAESAIGFAVVKSPFIDFEG
ncbi:MAG TPA: hypothetical protein VG028_14740 [Terriglobia bacterium]|nr:hypothetical protein [Terriglobia bacterium]